MEAYRAIDPPQLVLLLLPHLQKRLEVLVPGALGIERIQCLAHEVLDAQVSRVPQKILDRRHELGVEIAREGVAWVVDQDADQHEGVVLHVGGGACRVGEELADSNGGLSGCRGTGLCILDYRGEVDEFVSVLEEVSGALLNKGRESRLSPLGRGQTRKRHSGSVSNCQQGCRSTHDFVDDAALWGIVGVGRGAVERGTLVR